jgi:tetratricopeptide (TPR) repeat protein
VDDANEAIELANTKQLPLWAADGLVRLADSYIESGDPADMAKAEAPLRQALVIARQSEQRRVEAEANIGMANVSSGNPDAVAMYAQAALDYYKQHGFSEGTSSAYNFLARAQRDKDQLGPALKSSQELLAQAQQSGSRNQVALAQDLEGKILMRQEQYPAAAAMFKSSVSGVSTGVRPYVARDYAAALWRSGDYGAAEVMLREQGGKPGNTGATIILVEMQLSQEQYAKVVATVDAAMAGMSAAARPEEMVIARARAEAHLGKEQDAEQELEALKAEMMAGNGLTRAQFQLAAAEIALAGKQAALARENGEAALAYYRGLNAGESEIKAAALVTQACQMSGQGQDGIVPSKIGLDILHKLHDSWSPTQYQAFLSRPDVKDAAQQLEAGASAR